MTAEVTLTDLVQRSFIEMMKDVGTSVPGHIIAFDPETQLAQLQIGVKKINVNGDQIDAPAIIQCPVYIYGGSYCIEIEINEGDEGVILFSQRCIEAWKQTGGIAQNPILRFHDFSDAYFLPGMRSQPNKLSGYSNNGVKLRNQDGDKYVWLKNDGNLEINVNDMTVNGNQTINGNQSVNGNTTIDGDSTTTGRSSANEVNAQTSLKVVGKEVNGHIHGTSTGPSGPF